MAENTLTEAGTGAAADAVRETIAVQSQDATPVQVAKETPAAGDDTAEADAAAAAVAAAEAAAAANGDSGDAGKKRVETMPDWAQKRFDALAFEKREAERESKRLRDELAAARAAKPTAEDAAAAAAGGPDPNAANAGYGSKAAFDAAVLAESERREAQRSAAAAREQFDNACNETFKAGVAAFPDFAQAVGNLQNVGVMQPEFLEMVLAADDPSKVLYQLGGDPAKAQQIIALPPAKRAMELAKMATAAPAAKPPAPMTKAPAPMTPVEGTVRATAEPRDEDSDEEWFAKRDRQKAAQQGR